MALQGRGAGGHEAARFEGSDSGLAVDVRGLVKAYAGMEVVRGMGVMSDPVTRVG